MSSVLNALPTWRNIRVLTNRLLLSLRRLSVTSWIRLRSEWLCSKFSLLVGTKRRQLPPNLSGSQQNHSNVCQNAKRSRDYIIHLWLHKQIHQWQRVCCMMHTLTKILIFRIEIQNLKWPRTLFISIQFMPKSYWYCSNGSPPAF